MSVNIQFEVRLLVFCFLTGVLLMVSYDLFRILRIWIPHRPIVVGIEDMIYWIYAGLVTFALLYELNDGGLRGCAIVSVFMGMLLYDRLVSRFFLKGLKNMRKYLRIKLGNCLHRHRR